MGHSVCDILVCWLIGSPSKCNPIFHANSVCRCCCDTDGCNEEDGFCFETPRCPKLNLKRPLMVTCDNFKVKQNRIYSKNEMMYVRSIEGSMPYLK